MAHYKRIVKKREKTAGLVIEEPARLQEWVSENIQAITIGLAGLVIAAIVVYGIGYYQKVRLVSAHTRLYEAVRVVPMAGATTAQSDQAIQELETLISSGGPDTVINQARLELAALYMRSKDYVNAERQYAQTAAQTEYGTLYNELARAGQASSMIMSGREAEAEPILNELAYSASIYPRAEALMKLAFVQAALGKKSEAVSSLNRVKSEYEGFYPASYIEGSIRRVESGDTVKVVSKLKKLAAEPDKIVKPAGQGKLGRETVHTTGK